MHSERPRASALPTAADCRLEAAGFAWDAIRVPREIGTKALKILGNRSGAVIEDSSELVLYWFVTKGSAAGWDVPQTRPLGTGQYLVVPPPHRVGGPGPHWQIRPTDGRLITEVGALRTAVETAIAPLRAPQR